MFIDQEEKISPGRKWFFRLLKISFFLAAMVLVFITILANMGGSSQTLKESVEKFISETFGGKPAVMQKLVRLSFFPYVGVDIEKVQVTNLKPQGSIQDTEVVAVFSKIKFFMDFWDVVFSTPRFRTLLIEDAFLSKGVIGERSMTLERAYVDHDEAKNEAKIVANGLYDKDEWKLTLGVDVRGAFGKYEYEVGARSPFSLDVADIHVSGSMVKSSDNFMKIENFKIEGPGRTIQGDLYASLISSGVIKLKGELSLKDGLPRNVTLDLLLNYKEPTLARLSGDIGIENFAMSDLFGDNSVQSLFNRIYSILHDDPFSTNNAQAMAWLLNSADMDVDLDLKDVHVEGNSSDKATWVMRLRQKGGDVVMENIKGIVGNTPFDISALGIIQKDGEENKAGPFYALAASNDLTSLVFSILGEDAYKVAKNAISDDAQKIPCAMGKVFEKESDHLLSGLKIKTDDQPIEISVADYTFLTSAFDTPQEQSCLSFLKQAP